MRRHGGDVGTIEHDLARIGLHFGKIRMRGAAQRHVVRDTPARAGAELLTPDERRRLENEGYAPALGRTEPAVVTFTTLAAATSVAELLERLIGYGPTPRPSEVLLRFHEREMSTNITTPRPNHYCNRASGKVGRGMTEPFLDMAWSA